MGCGAERGEGGRRGGRGGGVQPLCARLRAEVTRVSGAGDRARAGIDPRGPGLPARLAHLAQIRLDQSDWKDAARCARQGLALLPDDEGCNTVLAAALIEMGYQEEAAVVSARLLAAHPESATAHAIEGWRLYHAHRLAGSRAAFRESLRLDPSQPNTHGGLRKATEHDHLFMRLLRRIHEPLTRRAARLPRGIRGLVRFLILAVEILVGWMLVAALMIGIGLLMDWSAGTPLGP